MIKEIEQAIRNDFLHYTNSDWSYFIDDMKRIYGVTDEEFLPLYNELIGLTPHSQKHISKYLGLCFVDWDSGYCCELYECPECGLKAQKPTMFSPEELFQFPLYHDVIELKTVNNVFSRRRAFGVWQPV